jgi:hypothetical protein
MALHLNDWFCMKPNRSSFIPRIPDDAPLMFCHSNVLIGNILTSIEAAFATDAPVKMLIYGDWGVGKTHLLYHLKWWFGEKQDEFPVEPIVIEIGDIDPKSRFGEIVRPFLDKLGLEKVLQLVHDYRGHHSDVKQALIGAGVSAHIADAFSKFLMSAPNSAPAPLVVQAFEYLRGRNLGRSAANVGLGEQLTQSNEFYEVLLGIGEMHRVCMGKRLLFIADEGANLEPVETDQAVRQHWVTANKLIFSDENRCFGFLYTVSGRREELPVVINEDQIKNRLGSNIYELENLNDNDVKEYINKLVESFVDKAKVEALVESGDIDASNYSWEAYPFTPAAKARFVDYYNRTQGDAKPRDISKKLDDLAIIAGKRGVRLIDDECLDKVSM